ncbi:MAG: hypothetical protein ACRECO_21170 [Xanthobacteraceae bacterium]
MAKTSAGKGGSHAPGRSADHFSGHIAASVRPTDAQRRYLERGLAEPGGKLPLFDRDGREVPRKTIEICMARGWAAPWLNNPVKPDWLACRLTAAGFRALGVEPPPSAPENEPQNR